MGLGLGLGLWLGLGFRLGLGLGLGLGHSSENGLPIISVDKVLISAVFNTKLDSYGSVLKQDKNLLFYFYISAL